LPRVLTVYKSINNGDGVPPEPGGMHRRPYFIKLIAKM